MLDPETGRPTEIPLPTAGTGVDAELDGIIAIPTGRPRRFFVPWMIGEGVLWYWTADGRVMGYNVMTGE